MLPYTLYHADALSVLPTLPIGSVQAVITDPPYCSGGTTPTQRTTTTARSKYVSSNAQHDLADFGGDNRDQRSYLAWMSLILSESLRITEPGGHCLVFSDWRQLPTMSDALQAAGWTWRGTVVWHKPTSRPRHGGFKSACEYILWGTNGPASKQDIYLPGLYSVSAPQGTRRHHITQKPVEGLMNELVRICPEGGTVLDPFMGSGSTGVAALSQGRRFVGIDASEHYHHIAAERLSGLDSAAA